MLTYSFGRGMGEKLILLGKLAFCKLMFVGSLNPC